MASIKGRYEYDDDDLTPGKKKEGGLHQNLFDAEGNLKGSARFIPDENQDDPDPEPIYVTNYVYDEAYERQLAREREETAELIANVVKALVVVAAPHAKAFWYEKARPFLEERRAKRATRKALKKAAKEPVVVEATVVDAGQELAVASEQYRTDMSSDEARARYLAALAARAFSDEQMNLVANANIVDGEALAELQHTLAGLPPHQVKAIIAAVESNPELLGGDLLAQLGKLLGVQQGGEEPIAIEERRED